MYTYVVLKWRSKSWDGIYKEGKLHMRTCDHGAEDHSDGHLVALREQVEEVVLDGDGPPREVEDDRRKRECQQLALSRRQFKIETCQNMKNTAFYSRVLRENNRAKRMSSLTVQCWAKNNIFLHSERSQTFMNDYLIFCVLVQLT